MIFEQVADDNPQLEQCTANSLGTQSLFSRDLRTMRSFTSRLRRGVRAWFGLPAPGEPPSLPSLEGHSTSGLFRCTKPISCTVPNW